MDGLDAEQPAADARNIGRRDIAATRVQTRRDRLRTRQIQSKEKDVMWMIEDLQAREGQTKLLLSLKLLRLEPFFLVWELLM